MARIIYALSGQGRGHSSRGMAITHGLRARGHEVRFCGGGAARDILGSQGEEVLTVPQLQQIVRDNTIQAASTILANWPSIRNLGQIVRRLAKAIEAWRAELIITDFEAFSWRAAELLQIPVISFNHQQVVTETRYSLPPGLRYHAHLARLIINIIAPRAPQKLLLTSFFYPPVKRPETTTIVPPIIRPEVQCLTPSREDFILVYYNQPEGSLQLLDRLRAHGQRYIIYNFPEPDDAHAYSNLVFKPARLDGFLDDLARCRGVLCTAGFTLISEALFLGKPLLAVPNRGIFEQTLNAIFLEREALGKAVIGRGVTLEDLSAFEESLDKMAGNLYGRPASGNKAALDFIENVVTNDCSSANQPQISAPDL